MDDKVKLGRKEVLKLLHELFEDNSHLRIAGDGIYIDTDFIEETERRAMFLDEAAEYSDHPKKDLLEPLLSFPCTVGELEGFVEWLGLGALYTEEELAACLVALRKDSISLEEYAHQLRRDVKKDRETPRKRIRIARRLLIREPELSHEKLGELLCFVWEENTEEANVKRSKRVRKKIREEDSEGDNPGTN